jgi:hypothetical protein
MGIVVWVVVFVGVVGLAGAGERPRLRGAETPRATDLLRAQRLAEKVEDWRRVRTRRHPGWVRGGSGWNAAGRRREDEAPRVTIVAPSRRPRRDPPETPREAPRAGRGPRRD